MKFSEVKGERVLDMIADLVEPVANIAEDKGALELFKPMDTPDGVTPQQFFMQRVKKALPALIKGHKGDIIGILSTIEGVKPEKYAEGLTVQKLIKDVIDIINDPEMVDFFASFAPRTEG